MSERESASMIDDMLMAEYLKDAGISPLKYVLPDNISWHNPDELEALKESCMYAEAYFHYVSTCNIAKKIFDKRSNMSPITLSLITGFRLSLLMLLKNLRLPLFVITLGLIIRAFILHLRIWNAVIVPLLCLFTIGWLIMTISSAINKTYDRSGVVEELLDTIEIGEQAIEFFGDKLEDAEAHGGIPQEYWEEYDTVWRLLCSGNCHSRNEIITYLEK